MSRLSWKQRLTEAAASKVQVVIFNGGTGVSRRDTTFDVLERKLEKTLPGFGEIFRMLSYEQIGSAAMMSRATAGVYGGKSSHLHTRVTRRGSLGLGQADRPRTRAFGLGSWRR